MALDEIYEYFLNYDKESFAVFSQQGAEPTEAAIERFEQKIGFQLPAEFREFAMHPIGGLYMEVHEELWPRPELLDVGPFWSFLYGLHSYSLSSEAPDWLNLSVAWQEMVEAGYPKLVPCLRIVGDADPYCFTEDQRIVIWRHEEPNDPESVSKTFSECLMHEIHQLGERKEQKLAGDG